MNACYKLLYGEPFSDFKGVRAFLKKCNEEDAKVEYSIFSLEDIETFAKDDNLHSKYWLVRKAVVAIYYFGGLFSREARHVMYENVTIKPDGIHVKYSKETGKDQTMVRLSICSIRKVYVSISKNVGIKISIFWL
jgi:hypothetical protein